MIPPRRTLIVKEHGNLRYPEGTACANLLIAGERGGDLAKLVFAGAGGALGRLALIPLITCLVPEQRLVKDLTDLGFSAGWRASHAHAEWTNRAYIRYIGAGAIACAGAAVVDPRCSRHLTVTDWGARP